MNEAQRTPRENDVQRRLRAADEARHRALDADAFLVETAGERRPMMTEGMRRRRYVRAVLARLRNIAIFGHPTD